MIADYFAHIVLSSVFARFSLVVPPFTRLGRAMRFFLELPFLRLEWQVTNGFDRVITVIFEGTQKRILIYI